MVFAVRREQGPRGAGKAAQGGGVVYIFTLCVQTCLLGGDGREDDIVKDFALDDSDWGEQLLQKRC